MNKLTINTWDQHAISPDDHIHGRLSPQLSVSLSLRWRPPLSLSLSLAGEVAEVGRPEELKLTGGLVAKMFADAGADERRTDGPS